MTNAFIIFMVTNNSSFAVHKHFSCLTFRVGAEHHLGSSWRIPKLTPTCLVFILYSMPYLLLEARKYKGNASKIYSFCLSDHSKGFGGKYGVQTDRKDKVTIVCFVALLLS